ncbi:MAG: hypothetical protein JWP08_4172 [Bryobacterales bacterium]|jgi:hypothetical protein|nr:hypothetical protein [Bryobacterales bacterium]
MGVPSLFHIKKAIASLNPEQVRKLADRPIRIGVYASSPQSFQRIEDFFLRDLRPERRQESAELLVREPSGQGPSDITLFDEGVIAPPRGLVFRSEHPDTLVRSILERHEDLGVPLARAFLPFRRPFVERVISKTSRENAIFSLTTALPDIIPSIIELPWAVAEFASDTAFITMNQLKMAFLIAAASDRPVGYREQKSEVAAVVAGAFGWRAIARQVVGKIPFGGGLVGKAAIAYAGTKVIGLSLDRLYAIGYTYSREERESLYRDAFQQGRNVAWRILTYLRPDLVAKFNRAESSKRAAASYPHA